MTSATPRICAHVPACPSAEALDRDAAHVLSAHPEQGWSLLCNGIIAFDDFGDLLPGGGFTGSPRAAMRGLHPHR